LKPQQYGEDHLARHPLVPHKSDHVRAVQRVDIAAEHALEVSPRKSSAKPINGPRF
jgi:hypothetical protein